MALGLAFSNVIMTSANAVLLARPYNFFFQP